MKRLNRQEFAAWLIAKRKRSGEHPLPKREMDARWKSYDESCEKKSANEREAARARVRAAGLDGVVFPPDPPPIRNRSAPPPQVEQCAGHIWMMKPYGLRCARKRCSLKVHGDPVKLWKEHCPRAPIPAPPQMGKKHRSPRAIRRAEARKAKRQQQQQQKAKHATSYQPTRMLYETGLHEMGFRHKDFKGGPAWQRQPRTHPSSERNT